MSARDQIVKNIWDGLEFYCMNHDEPVKMVEKRGVSTFYACPRFMLADDEHPDGHQKFEPMCKNNLSFAQAEKIVSMLADKSYLQSRKVMTNRAYSGDELTILGSKLDIVNIVAAMAGSGIAMVVPCTTTWIGGLLLGAVALLTVANYYQIKYLVMLQPK